MSPFEPLLAALSAAQQRLWPQLSQLPGRFVLYGGTALALRLGHRQSVDFDFFSSPSFHPVELQRQLPWANGAETLQKTLNTLTLRTTESVRVSFFGGLTFGQVEPPERAGQTDLWVASLKDLMATKLNTIYQRAEAKDYVDIDALLNAGISLETGLACARAIYGSSFNLLLPLKALTFFDDGDLVTLSKQLQERLTTAVVNLGELPEIRRHSAQIG
jgi:hypothetical protein